MFRSFIMFTARNLARNRLHTIINVGGVALGIVCALAIFLIIKFELSFDTHHQDAGRIYRIVTVTHEFGQIKYGSGVQHALPRALRSDFPEIEHVTIVDQNFTPSVYAVTRDDGSIARFKTEPGAAFIDPDFFKIFDYDWIQGNPDDALRMPGSVVLSQSLAKKFFGDQEPLGQRILYDNEHEVHVTGIVADPPLNTDFPFDMLLAYDFDLRGSENWGEIASAVQCYVKLPDHLDPAQIDSQLGAFLAKYREPERAEKFTLSLQPLHELHFDTRFETFSGRTVAKESLVALGFIGLLLLTTACINFVNLNTALAVRRSREVGVRKVLGGTVPQLVLHFLAETAVVMLVAIVLAVALTEIISGPLQSFLGYRVAFDLFGEISVPAFLFVLFVSVTLAAGIYPARHLSRFSPSAALRNKLGSQYGEGLSLRKGLSLAQFAISQALIICTIAISSQMSYFRNADMGFNRDAIVELELPVNDQRRLERFKEHLLQQAAIRYVSFSNTGAASSSTWNSNYSLPDEALPKKGRAQVKFVDQDFIATYGLKLLAGENFTANDTLKGFLVNEAFAREIGDGDDLTALMGKIVKVWGRTAPITGVVKNFNVTSLHDKIEPVVMLMQNRFWQAGIKIDSRDMKAALAIIEQAWLDAFPEYVFAYTFLDDAIAKFYEEEQQTAQLLNLCTVIAIVIGCLGLFGLISYMTTQRTKEIGIRKVLGASLINVLTMFSKELAILILLAFVVAAPVAYYFMEAWLADFAYRIDLDAGIFLAALASAFVIAFVTVGYKSVMAALANPVESLRCE